MRRKLSWPFISLIAFSFVAGATWGVKLIRDRTKEEGRLESEAKLRILAPPGIFSKELLNEFQRREKIEVELSVETFPASLLRRALKSAPGTYDAALVFHYQVSALRGERKLATLYDTRAKFPTTIAPDFRKLPNDRNLMDTAPLLWGLLGQASKKEFEHMKLQLAFWPSTLIGLEDSAVQPNAFAMKMQLLLGSLDALENHMKKGAGSFAESAPTGPIVVSHGSLSFSPLKESGLIFEPLRVGTHEYYPMWILTLAALGDGDLERTRKFVKFLLEPAQNIALVQTTRTAASTLREQSELAVLPKALQASYFRAFSIDKILLERDERIRSADEVLEQMVLGAGAKIVKSVEPIKTAATIGQATPPPKLAASPKKKNAGAKPIEASGDEEVSEGSGDSDVVPPGDSVAPSAPAAPANPPATEPSADLPHDD